MQLLLQLAGGQLGQVGVQEAVQIAASHAPGARGNPALEPTGQAKPVRFKILLRKMLGRRTCGGWTALENYFFSSPVASWVR